jgi:hypothetical protein
MKNIILPIIVVATLILTGAGCKKSDSTTGTSPLYLHLHSNIDTNEADYGTVYTMSSGRQMSLTMAQLLISNIQLIRTDGTTYSIPNVVIRKELGTEQYFVANVPTGSYKSIKFNVGLDATTNKMTPTTADSALDHADMWFGSAAQPDGYIFVNAEGTIDTTTAGNGTVAQMQSFMYHIGTNAHLNTVTMPNHSPVYSFTVNQAQYVHIIIDYSKLFNGVQLNNSTNLMIHTATDNVTTISNTVSGNISAMFSYEE